MFFVKGRSTLEPKETLFFDTEKADEMPDNGGYNRKMT
jgi:hypothetical protein